MTTVSVTTKGEREIELLFDTFPQKCRQKLAERIRGLTEKLQARVQADTPVKTGLLRSEITPRVYADQPDRVAGYVSVFAGGNSKEYPKAGALEYGWWAQRDPKTGISQRLFGNNRRMKARMTGSHHIFARMYLRNPFDQMRPEIEASLNEAISEVVAEEGG